MRFIYADPGLENEVGHHANACRVISAELRGRGIEPEVLGYKGVTEGLQREMGAKPFFRYHTYLRPDDDPICGWLRNFYLGYEITLVDLEGIAGVGAGDLVYLNSAKHEQFMAAVMWLSRMPAERRPNVVVEFGIGPGVEIEDTPKGIGMTVPDPRGGGGAMLYRLAAMGIPKEADGRIHLRTFDAFNSQVYSLLLSRPVGVLPLLQRAVRPVRLRTGEGGITVAVMGHQRAEKGYALMPRVTEILLAADPRVRVLAHNGEPEGQGMAEAQKEMRRLASAEPRIRLDERAVDAQGWLDLLDAADVVACPYSPVFRASYSALAAEAIANGIPLVVPAKFSLAHLCAEFGVGEQFEKFEAQGVADAVMRVVKDFDSHARRSLAAAQKWPTRHGPKHTVDAILAAGRGR